MQSALAAASCVMLIALSALATHAAARVPQIAITQQSIRINGSEVRTAAYGYISLASAEKVLGKPQDIYPAGLGVSVHAWRDVGIHIQRGWRGPEKGRFFKLQVWLVDYYDKAEAKHSGRFRGHVTVDGVDIVPEATLDTLRPHLEAAGFDIAEHPGVIEAEKGSIIIFTVGVTNQLERVEVRCP